MPAEFGRRDVGSENGTRLRWAGRISIVLAGLAGPPAAVASGLDPSVDAPPQADARAEGEEDDTARFDRWLERGLAAYEAGDFEAAGEFFLRAHAVQPEPELVYNAARSFEKGLLRERAVQLYERFVSLPGTTAELRARALNSLEQLRRELEALEARARAVESEPSALPRPEPRPESPPPGAAPAAAVTPPAVDRTPEVLLLSGGAAAAVGAVVLGVLALDAESSFRDATGPERVDLKGRAEGRALAADVLWGTAATAAATGLVLWLVKKK